MDTDKKSKTSVCVRLFATLNKFTPDSSENYLITPGITIQHLIEELGIPQKEAKLIFIDSVKGELTSVLNGGERVGIFPPIGGG